MTTTGPRTTRAVVPCRTGWRPAPRILRGLPPTTIINAQIDPLRSDGETLAAAMRAAGDKVEQRTFPGVTHEFFGMVTIVRGAKDANDLAVARLKAAFAMAPAKR